MIDHKSKAQWGENVQLVQDTKAVYQSVFQNITQLWRRSLQRATGQCFDDDHPARLRNYFQTAIDRKRAEMRSSPERAEAERGWSTLERLERANFTSSDEELCYEFNNLFNASFDTVGLIVSFALRMLAMNQEHQKRAAEEALGAEGVAGRCGAGEVAFLERCLLETIRLFPIGPFLTRACRKTLCLSDKTFAMMCCKSLLCQILQEFEFSCDPTETVAGMKLSCDIPVREIGGTHVNIRRRRVKA